MADTESARERGNPIGPTGIAVGRNVRRLRIAAGTTQAELAERLAKRGRPIPVASIGRLENGERRVEVDDLTALAAALNVAPAELLGYNNAGTAYARASQAHTTLSTGAREFLSAQRELKQVREALDGEISGPLASAIDELLAHSASDVVMLAEHQFKTGRIAKIVRTSGEDDELDQATPER